MHYLIIGSGAAGVSAAKELRRHGQETDQITVISKDTYPFYYRPRLIEYLSGEIEIKDLIINNKDWFADNDIQLHLQEKVEEIDTENQIVISGKNKYEYDKLLLAQGAHAFVPPIPGINDPRIYTLRDIDDAREIHRKAQEAEKAVVIGCGLLGLEAGFNLMKAGVEVTSLEQAPRLLFKQLDTAGSNLLRRKLKKKGLNFILDSDTIEFVNEGQKITIKLDNNRELTADMILLSTGVKPNLELTAATNIKTKGAVVVDNKMKTSVENVFAAGDAAEVEGKFYGIWPPAMKQGQVAGRNMLGKEDKFSGYVSSYKLKVIGVNVVSVGNIDPDIPYDLEVEKNNNWYKKIIKDKDGGEIGAILVGDVPEQNKIVAAVKS